MGFLCREISDKNFSSFQVEQVNAHTFGSVFDFTAYTIIAPM